MAATKADVPKPPEEFNGYSYDSIEQCEKRHDERRRLYPTPQQDAKFATMFAAPVAPRRSKRK